MEREIGDERFRAEDEDLRRKMEIWEDETLEILTFEEEKDYMV